MSSMKGQSLPGSSDSSLNSSPQHTITTPSSGSPTHREEGWDKSSPLDSLCGSDKLSPREGSSEISSCDTSSMPQSLESFTSITSHHVTSDVTVDEMSSPISLENSPRHASLQSSSSENSPRHSSTESPNGRTYHNTGSPIHNTKSNSETLDTGDLDLIPEKETSTMVPKRNLGK